MPASGDVSFTVYDVRGRRVYQEDLRGLTAGGNVVDFRGRDLAGRDLPTGVYFYSLRSGNESVVRKLVIAR